MPSKTPREVPIRLGATFVGLLVASTLLAAFAQTAFREPGEPPESWTRPFPGFRIVGSLYYVGTHDLASYLITTEEGNILVNTGVTSSVPMIRSNVESLGFSFSDTRLLLTTQAHWDHVAGMAEIQRLTGARLLVHQADAPLLEDGGNSDFRFGGHGAMFEPATVDERLKHGETVRLGTTEVTLHHHPGHTKGSSSFTFTTRDDGRDYQVLIVNMGSINEGVALLDSPGYPTIADDYARTFARQMALTPTVWVSSHASQFGLHEKYSPGDPYDPTRFVDPEGYRAAIQRYEERYLDQLRKERLDQAPR